LSEFRPHVPPGESPPELTPRALLLGVALGIVFGASSTYLGLRVGLTVSASIPIAVIAIAVLRPRAGKRAILEHNITQTLGSAGESVAGAVVFTVPAVIFLGYPLQVGLTTLIAATGGLLGVLLMVPLRRYLIVKEHGVLRYPEGKACAEILIAGEKGGTSARKVFVGMAVGAGLMAFQRVLQGVRLTVSWPLSFLKGASVDADFEPALLGVGYIIGYRTSVLMVAGSLLASFVLIPVFLLVGSGLTTPLPPATDTLIKDMSAGDLWRNYVRYIGAGAVAAGGLFALAKALPSIVSSIVASTRSLLGGAVESQTVRTDRDTPTLVLALGSIGIVGLIWAIPAFEMNLLGAVLILGLGFFFAVVSSRITGEVGSSSCPLSGMTIGVLMATCGVFLLTGREGPAWSRLALMVGAIVCVAISNAGTCSQDLKTGYLVGATPVRQQGALLIGVLTSVLAVGWTAYLINTGATEEERVTGPVLVPPEALKGREVIESKTDQRIYRFVRLDRDALPATLPAGNYLVDEAMREVRYRRVDGIGEDKFPAPQSRLMAVIIDGLLSRKLPWDLILLGAALAVFVELLGFGALTFAVGVYLPLSATMPVFLGGLARKLADRAYRRVPDAEEEPEGTLYCAGLIAGASLVGILATALAFLPGYDGDGGFHPKAALLRDWPFAREGLVGDLALAGLLALLGFLIFRSARGRSAAAR